MSVLLDRLTPVLGASLARQLAFADLLGERNWAVDIPAGTATFGGDLSYPIQLLGTEAEDSRTWLWAWANTESNLPPQLLSAAEWARGYGREHGIAELTDAEVPLDLADGHLLAMLVGGLTGRCYYRGPYAGGALFFLVENAPDGLADVRPERAITVLSQAIQLYPVDHRVLATSFLQQIGYAVTESTDGITARHASGSTLSVTFDDHGRLANLSGELRADAR